MVSISERTEWRSPLHHFAEALELHFALLVDYCVALGDSQDLLSPTLKTALEDRLVRYSGWVIPYQGIIEPISTVVLAVLQKAVRNKRAW